MRKNKSLLFVITILISLAITILIAACGPASSSVEFENTPEPTIAQTGENKQEPIPAETIKPTEIPSSPQTETITPTASILSTKITDDFGVEMVLVPAGEFIMGNDTEPVEAPSRVEYLDNYYIDTYEITNRLYTDCVNENVCPPPLNFNIWKRNEQYFGNPKYDNYPVVYVDWEMAKIYCEWRNAYLPSEAQWEKAARGTDGRIYPWGKDDSCNRANYRSCYISTTEVGSFESGQSPYGLYDMAGNVWEWVADTYDAYPDGNPEASEYFGKGLHVIRGGSFYNSANLNRTTYRQKDDSAYYTYTGFRCAKDANP
jgi:serine/threonine-protein kinase